MTAVVVELVEARTVAIARKLGAKAFRLGWPQDPTRCPSVVRILDTLPAGDPLRSTVCEAYKAGHSTARFVR